MSPSFRITDYLGRSRSRADDSARDAAASRLYSAFVEETGRVEYGTALKDVTAAKTIFDASPEVQAAVLVAIFKGTAASTTQTGTWFGRYYCQRALITQLFRRPLPLTESHLLDILAAANSQHFFALETPRTSIIAAVEKFIAHHGLSPRLRTMLQATHYKLRSKAEYKDDRELAARVLIILGGTVAKKPCPITDHDAWSKNALARLKHIDESHRGTWLALLEHAAAARGSKPSQLWLRQAMPLVEAVGKHECTECMTEWLALIGARGRPAPGQVHHEPTVPNPDNVTILKGLVWASSHLDEVRMLGPISSCAEACFKKVPNIGPRSVKLGNACLWYLSTMKGDRAIAELVRIRAKARHPSIRTQIDKSINRQAAARGQTPQDAIELAVPTFDLALPGTTTRHIGDFEAVLIITGSTSTQVTWKAPTGRITRSTPKAAKDSDPDGVKSLARTQRDIERTLPGQRDRLERLYLSNRSWPLADWRKRFADHPLLHNMTSRLIWSLADSPSSLQPTLFHNNRFLNSSGHPITPSPNSHISLWHPISSPAEEVAAWRDRLAALSIQQPFKQAHREIYILTDAERTTDTYSNRFAAHILRQHQMAELCRARSWNYRLAGAHFDSGGAVPTLGIPSTNLIAEFWVEPIDDEELGSGISRFVATDQVCFRRGIGDRLPLRDIPPIVFSETMRDVDLFVGVCSIGNDPTWHDGGPGGRHQQYWQNFSWGELTASGATRREVLTRIIPRLSIAAACSLDARFLIVRGKLRTYKIHLGSANILMEPNDQYLCIVPGRKDTDVSDIALPFEGDRTLAIILSKAFMLAADDRITDPTITRQINHPTRA